MCVCVYVDVTQTSTQLRFAKMFESEWHIVGSYKGNDSISTTNSIHSYRSIKLKELKIIRK